MKKRFLLPVVLLLLVPACVCPSYCHGDSAQQHPTEPDSTEPRSTQVDSRAQGSAPSARRFPREANHQNPRGVRPSGRRSHCRGNTGGRNPRSIWIEAEHHRLQRRKQKKYEAPSCSLVCRIAASENFLASKGLKADSIGDQGYLLFSDKTHLIVAANTGQGLVLRRADAAPAASPGRWKTNLPGGFHSRLAKHGVARCAG